MAMDLQSTDGGKRLKLVAAIGNAPIFYALQAYAHLSKPNSQLKLMVFGATQETSHQSATNPLCFISILYYTGSFWLNVAFCELLGYYGQPSS